MRLSKVHPSQQGLLDDKRLFVVGTQLNDNALSNVPLMSPSGEFLARMMGVPSLHKVAICHNLFQPGEVVTIDCRERVRDALKMAESCKKIKRVVFLINPKRAITSGDVDWFEWIESDAVGDVAFSPHPSGKNRWWNDPTNKQEGLAFWQEVGMFVKGEGSNER